MKISGNFVWNDHKQNGCVPTRNHLIYQERDNLEFEHYLYLTKFLNDMMFFVASCSMKVMIFVVLHRLDIVKTDHLQHAVQLHDSE